MSLNAPNIMVCGQVPDVMFYELGMGDVLASRAEVMPCHMLSSYL